MLSSSARCGVYSVLSLALLPGRVWICARRGNDERQAGQTQSGGARGARLDFQLVHQRVRHLVPGEDDLVVGVQLPARKGVRNRKLGQRRMRARAALGPRRGCRARAAPAHSDQVPQRVVLALHGESAGAGHLRLRHKRHLALPVRHNEAVIQGGCVHGAWLTRAPTCHAGAHKREEQTLCGRTVEGRTRLREPAGAAASGADLHLGPLLVTSPALRRVLTLRAASVREAVAAGGAARVWCRAARLCCAPARRNDQRGVERLHQAAARFHQHRTKGASQPAVKQNSDC